MFFHTFLSVRSQSLYTPSVLPQLRLSSITIFFRLHSDFFPFSSRMEEKKLESVKKCEWNVESNHIITSDINQTHEILVIAKQINLFMKSIFCVVSNILYFIIFISFLTQRNPFSLNSSERSFVILLFFRDFFANVLPNKSLTLRIQSKSRSLLWAKNRVIA